MRPSIAALFILPIAALRLSPISAPFYEPELESLSSNETLTPNEHELLKRDGNCPFNYDSCSTLAAKYGGACCTAGSFCTTDLAHNIACCPTGVTCTGTVGIQTATTTTGTSTGITITTPAAAVVSVVSNSYFPFPVVPATYIDAAACLSAYSACQTNYAACTADLQGSSFGVTVVAPNGAGVTVAPTAQNLGSANAVAVCSSLSSEACGGIQSASCAVYGTATTAGGTFFVGGTSNPGCRQTMGAVAKVGMVAGVGLGIAGQLV